MSVSAYPYTMKQWFRRSALYFVLLAVAQALETLLFPVPECPAAELDRRNLHSRAAEYDKLLVVLGTFRRHPWR